MKQYTQEELRVILENHQHWWNRDCIGWEDMKADLSNTNLSDANLINADLRDANLRGAVLCSVDLISVDLRGANLSDANLIDADLRCADLRGAHLSNADLSCANLNSADLRSANLSNVDLIGANLKGADLRGAVLSNTNLSSANLSNVILNGVDFKGARNMPFIPQTCPEEGSFIGYKKASGYIVKLEILADARRCSANGRKCRCDKAKILDIQNLNINAPCKLTEVASSYDNSFIYRVGEIVEEPEFDENRWHECSKGIHFFISRQEAVRYQ